MVNEKCNYFLPQNLTTPIRIENVLRKKLSHIFSLKERHYRWIG